MGKYDDDDFMEEMMLDVWDGLKEEPDSRKKGYPAKKKKKSDKKIRAEGKKTKKRFRIHYRFDGLDISEIQEAYSESQAVTVFCKTADAWYIKKEIAKKTRGFWVEEVKEEDEKSMKKELNKETLQAAGIIEKNDKEEQKMKEDKEMNLDQLVDAANKAAEAEVVNVAEAQQVKENIDEKKEDEINMMDNENKKVEQVEVQGDEPIVIENAIPVTNIVLETITGNDKELSVALMAENEKKGTIDAVRVTDGEFETVGSYVISGGYSFPLFRISSKWFKKTTLGVNRKVDTTNRTIAFSGSKNYMALLKLMLTDEEIEQAKAAEISRRFPPICQRSESKGIPKNIFITVVLPDGSQLKLDGWVQREHRPLYMENSDRTTTVRWDFGKGYQDPSIKYNGRMLRKNHDGVSGNVEDAKVFEIIKSAILAELDKA